MRLHGKVAIITGAGQGIGRTYALRFAQEGAGVVVADIRHDNAHRVVADLQGAGGRGAGRGHRRGRSRQRPRDGAPL